MNRSILCNTVLALLLLSLAACQTENSGSGSGTDINQNQTPTQNVKLKVGETQVSIEADNNLTSKFRIEAENVRWAVTKPTACDWLTVDPLRGNATVDVNLTATANTDVDHTRMVELGVDAIESTYKFSQNVMVVQKAATPYISVEENSYSVPGQGDSFNVKVYSNVDWEVFCDYGWVHPSKYASDNLKISVDKNAGQQRTGTIMLRRKGTETVLCTVAVTQGELHVTSTTERMLFTPDENYQSITFTADDAWEASTGGISWLSLSPVTGVKGTYTMYVRPTKNEARESRNAFVYIEMKDVNKKLEIPVTQSGVTSEKSHEELTFTSVQSTGDISYKSNVDWSASSPSEFITINPTWGRANKETTITVTVDANATAEDREGKIYFKPSFGPSDSIVVTQHKRLLETDKSSILFTKDGGEMNVEVTAESSWTASTNVSWVQLSTTSGTGNGTIKVTAKSNATFTDRDAVIHVISGKVKKDINIKQTGTKLQADVSVSFLEFANSAGKKSFNINSNATWEISTSADWITLSKTSGSGSEKIDVTVGGNIAFAERSGNITVKINGSVEKIIGVIQAAKDVKGDVSPSSLRFGDIGGTQEISIDANTTWTATSSVDWLELSKESGYSSSKISVTAAANKESTARNGKISIKINKLEREIAVTQEPFVLHGDVNTDALKFNAEGGVLGVVINTNGEWTAETDAEWIHPASNSGELSTTLNVTVDPNTKPVIRTGTLTISFSTITQTVTITQEGDYLKITCDDVLTNSNASIITMSLVSEGEWTAKTENEWLHLDPMSGTGEAKIKISVDDNASVSERTGSVTFENDKASKIYTFTQPGRVLSCNVSNVDIASQGGTSEVITVATDGKYSVTTDKEWLSIKEDKNTFTITALPLTNQSKREGDVTVSLTDLKDGQTLSVKVHVTQLRPKFVQIGIDGFDEDEEI